MYMYYTCTVQVHNTCMSLTSGDFGSERLVQQIVDSIMHATERRENLEQVTGHHPPTPDDERSNPFDREQGVV